MTSEELDGFAVVVWGETAGENRMLERMLSILGRAWRRQFETLDGGVTGKW